jgi:hypothetical protein
MLNVEEHLEFEHFLVFHNHLVKLNLQLLVNKKYST